MALPAAAHLIILLNEVAAVLQDVEHVAGCDDLGFLSFVLGSLDSKRQVLSNGFHVLWTARNERHASEKWPARPGPGELLFASLGRVVHQEHRI